MLWEAVIGLEMHARLSTRSKLFCGCANRYGAAANTLTCAVCAGLPGGMPVLNAAALRSAVLVAVATGGEVPAFCRFDRKNYFYPDLPKGYQITQFDHPISRNGELSFLCGDEEAQVPLERIHLEEDAGKTLHPGDVDGSLIDLNRAGTPLLEVVTRPALVGGAQAAACMRGMRLLLRTLGVGDGDMEKGSLRCDVNISVRRRDQGTLGTKVELKNLNSFHSVQRAVESETARQIQILESGSAVQQETRLWDAPRHQSRVMRLKEDTAAYGYIPETDLGVLSLDASWVATLQKTLPELPEQRRERWRRQFAMPQSCMAQLIDDLQLAAFFEAAAMTCDDTKRLANWMCNELPAALRDAGQTLEDGMLTPGHLAELVTLRAQGVLAQSQAKQVLDTMLRDGGRPRQVANQQQVLEAPTAIELTACVDSVLHSHPDVVRRLQDGKHSALEFLVGQVLRATSGQADPASVRRLLQSKLEQR